MPRSFWKGMVAGAVSGLAATWMMTQYQTGSQKLIAKLKRAPGEDPGSRQNQQTDRPDNTTVVVAKKVAHAVGADVPEHRKQAAGNVVHYGFGTAMGLVYGVLSELTPVTTAGRGLAYAAVLWTAADEVALPAAGLAKWWPEYPLEVHANALVSHLVYGKTMDEIRRGLRRLLDSAAPEPRRLHKTDFRPPRVHPRSAGPIVRAGRVADVAERGTRRAA